LGFIYNQRTYTLSGGKILRIRQEKASDYDEVCALVKTSFAAASDPDETVQDYLNEVRKKDAFIPELSLVAENDEGKLIGQIVLYKTNIMPADSKNGSQPGFQKEVTELVLSPLCVHPDFRGRGIARALMEKAFEIAKDLGYTAVFLCGDPKFYRRMGFRPTFEHNIFHITDVEKNAEWCLALELSDGALRGISGMVDIL